MRLVTPLFFAVLACAPSGGRTAPSGADDRAPVGTTTLQAARAGPAQLGTTRGPFAMDVPCSETRYVGFSPRTALTARFEAAGEGAREFAVRAQLLDGKGQPVLEQRYRVTTSRERYTFSLGAGATQPVHVSSNAMPAEFLRLTVENPHCTRVRFQVEVD